MTNTSVSTNTACDRNVKKWTSKMNRSKVTLKKVNKIGEVRNSFTNVWMGRELRGTMQTEVG